MHARIYAKLGIKKISILNRTLESSIESQKKIENTYNIDVKTYKSINDMMVESKPDIISICTPPEYHYEFLTKLYRYPLSIFCEKPLFWNNNLDKENFNNAINSIMKFANRNLMVNTSNASLITQLKKYFTINESIRDFSFTFNTNGKYRNKNIGIDLLPHALSLLIELCGHKELYNLKKEIKKNSYSCNFNYGNIKVFFSFMQKSSINKKLSFSINENKFERFQKTDNNNYRVFINHLNTGKNYELVDPFEYYINKFIDNHFNYDELSAKNHINDSILNMRLLYKII